MQKYKIKIFLAGMSLLMAAVMLVTASVAWFTISTAPEISGIQVGIYADRTLLLSSDNTEYVQYLDLSPKFKDLAPLHPVSTVDGLNWFIPTYNSKTGELRDPSEFILDDTLKYANVIIHPDIVVGGDTPTGSDEDEDEDDGNDYYNDTNPQYNKEKGTIDDNENKGYYVYADFWMMTEEEYGCRVRLTIPHYKEFDTNEGSDFMTAFSRQKDAQEEVDQGWYGSYVLNSGFKVSEAEEDGEPGKITLESREAETSMRVGFLLDPDDPPEEEEEEETSDAETPGTETPDAGTPDTDSYADEKNKFFIYEPNADIRSASNKPLGTNDKSEVDYILDYKFNSESYEDGTYFVTQPIEKKEYTRPKTDPETGEELKDPETGETLTEKYFGGKVVDITDYTKTHLIIQKASEWDLDKAKAKVAEGKLPNSNDVKYPMGGFLNTETVYKDLTADTNTEKNIDNGEKRLLDVSKMKTDIAGSSVIVTLKKDTPLKVRLFIWIEGQDVDCWNDIAAGRFIVNLELAGETLPPPTDDT